MTQPWPWPDNRLERRSRIAHMYRDALTDEAPDICQKIDQLMRNYGQNWILDPLPLNPDELLTARQLAELADVHANTVRNWVHRWPLHRKAVNDRGENLYRWGDIIEHQRKQHRAQRAT